MKVLLGCLALLALLLSVTPCCGFTCEEEHTVCNNEQEDAKNQDDCDNCSPFYVCGSCTGFTFPKLFTVKITPTLHSPRNIIVSPSLLLVATFTHKLLKPPRFLA